MCPPLTEDDEGAVRRCVATGFRILNVSFLDWEQREFLGAEQEPSRCARQTGCYLMDDLLRGVSFATAIIPMVSGWCGASLSMPQGPRVWQQDSIHSVRQNVGLWPQV